MISKKELIDLYKSEKIATDIINLNRQLLELFLKCLPKNAILEELIQKWDYGWKHIASKDFLNILEEFAKLVLKKNKDLDSLFTVWLNSTHPYFKWLLRNRILTKLGVKELNLNPEEILNILESKRIKLDPNQSVTLLAIIYYQDYPKNKPLKF